MSWFNCIIASQYAMHVASHKIIRYDAYSKIPSQGKGILRSRIFSISCQYLGNQKHKFIPLYHHCTGRELEWSRCEPELNQKWTGSEPEVNREWTGSGSEVGRKWTQSELVRKWTGSFRVFNIRSFWLF